MTRPSEPNPGRPSPLGAGFTFVSGGVGGDRPQASRRPAQAETSIPLAEAEEGQRFWVVDLPAGLEPKGLHLGDEVTILSRSQSGSVVLSVNGKQLGFCRDRTQTIYVSGQPQSRQQLRHFKVGAAGRILGYNCPHRGYRKRLLAMGLTPGTTFTVTRHAPLGDPVEICVRGFSLSLRKDEACALLVEAVEE